MKINNIRKILNKKPIARNASWLIGGKLAQMIISFFVGLITARYLGPDNYGLINYGNAYLTFFVPICTLGLDSIIVNELIKNEKQSGKILGSTIGIRCISSFVAIAMIQIILMIIEPNNTLLWKITFLQSGTLLFRSFDMIEYWYQSKLQSKVTSIITFIAYVITAIYKIIILILGKSVIWFAFSNTLDLLLIAILYTSTFCIKEKIRLKFSITCVTDCLKKSYHFILSSLMVAVYAQMDRIMLGKMLDERAVGLYSVGTAICAMWTFVLLAIINSIRPSIIEAKRDGLEEKYHSRIVQLYAIVFWIGVFVSVCFCVFGKFIIYVLYGKAYMGALGAFRIVTWYTCFSYLGVARGTWMVCENKQKYEKILAFFGAVFNIIFNIVFINLWGICGAAVATLLTEILTNFLVPFMFKDIRTNSRFIWLAISRPIQSLKGKMIVEV